MSDDPPEDRYGEPLGLAHQCSSMEHGRSTAEDLAWSDNGIKITNSSGHTWLGGARFCPWCGTQVGLGPQAASDTELVQQLMAESAPIDPHEFAPLPIRRVEPLGDAGKLLMLECRVGLLRGRLSMMETPAAQDALDLDVQLSEMLV